MKTGNYITASILLLVTAITTADANAQPRRHFQPDHPARIAPAPSRRSASIFVQIARPPIIHRHFVPPPPPRTILVPAPAPIIIHEPTVTVWITNTNGSRSSVILKRQGPWYIGPRGEHYTTLPTEAQLRPLYGLDCGPVQPATVSLYITTDNGALRLITLTRTANGYIGPSGEFNAQMPTEAQLRMAYGR